jgi:hypothetical protein
VGARGGVVGQQVGWGRVQTGLRQGCTLCHSTALGLALCTLYYVAWPPPSPHTPDTFPSCYTMQEWCAGHPTRCARTPLPLPTGRRPPRGPHLTHRCWHARGCLRQRLRRRSSSGRGRGWGVWVPAASSCRGLQATQHAAGLPQLRRKHAWRQRLWCQCWVWWVWTAGWRLWAASSCCTGCRVRGRSRCAHRLWGSRRTARWVWCGSSTTRVWRSGSLRQWVGVQAARAAAGRVWRSGGSQRLPAAAGGRSWVWCRGLRSSAARAEQYAHVPTQKGDARACSSAAAAAHLHAKRACRAAAAAAVWRRLRGTPWAWCRAGPRRVCTCRTRPSSSSRRAAAAGGAAAGLLHAHHLHQHRTGAAVHWWAAGGGARGEWWLWRVWCTPTWCTRHARGGSACSSCRCCTAGCAAAACWAPGAHHHADGGGEQGAGGAAADPQQPEQPVQCLPPAGQQPRWGPGQQRGVATGAGRPWVGKLRGHRHGVAMHT